MRVVVFACLLTYGAAHAGPDAAASGEFEHAKTAYDAGDYSTATAHFRRAFELDPKPEYLFGWAQAVRKAGDCPFALELYNKLLEMDLVEERRVATKLAMARCTATAAAPPVVSHEPEPWYTDGRGHVLVGAGVVALGAGTWLTIESISDERAARTAPTYGEHERLGDRARLFRIIGVGAIAVGAISTSWGVYRYATRGRARTLTAWVNGTGGGLAIGGTW